MKEATLKFPSVMRAGGEIEMPGSEEEASTVRGPGGAAELLAQSVAGAADEKEALKPKPSAIRRVMNLGGQRSR